MKEDVQSCQAKECGPRLIEQYADPLRVWAKLVISFLVVYFALQYRDGVCSTGQALILLVSCLCCWALIPCINAATLPCARKEVLVRNIFFCFGALQMAFHLNQVWEENPTAKVHLLFDLGTILYSETPQLMFCFNGAPTAACILFVSGHVARSFLSYLHLWKMPWCFAVLRALTIHAMAVAAAQLMLKRARAVIHTKKHVPRHQQRQQQEKEQRQQQQPHGHEKKQQNEQHEVHRLGASGQGNKVVDNEHQSVRQAEGMQQGARCSRTSNGLRGVDWASSYSSSTHQMCQASGFSNPGLQEPVFKAAPLQEARCSQQPYGSSNPGLHKGLFEAVRVLEARRRQGAYASMLDQPSSPGPDKTLRSLQDACRFVVKLNNAKTPDDMPKSGLPQLQHKIRKYHECLAPALRAGCLVISYDTCLSIPGCSMEDECEAVLAEAKQWAREQGLLETADDSLTVQACPHSAWDTAPDKQLSSKYRMAVHAPFLILNSGCAAPNLSASQQPLQLQHERVASTTLQQPHPQQHEHVETLYDLVGQRRIGDRVPQSARQQEASCELELTLSAPPGFGGSELRGWQGAADAPEDLPDAVKSHSLCLLASLDGQFLGVTVKRESLRENGERVAQVCVSLPADALGSHSRYPKALVLELWAAGALACCYSAILLPYSSTAEAALAELQVWAAGQMGGQPEDSGPFMRDLVRLMRFGSYTQQQQQQQQQQQARGGEAAADADHSGVPMQQQLEPMVVAVGMDLLVHSLRRGMEGVAGLLLEFFASIPFSIPTSTLLDTDTLLAELRLLGIEEEATPAVEEEASATVKGGASPKEAMTTAPQSDAYFEGQPLLPPIPPISTRHSSTQRDDTLHSCQTTAAPTPSFCTIAAPQTTPTTATTPSAAGMASTSTSAAPAATIGSALALAMAAPLAGCRMLTAMIRVLYAQPSKEEADYRAWTNAQVAPLARSWCRLCLLIMGVGALRMAFSAGVPPLLEFSAWGVMLLGYTLGAVSIRPDCPYSEVILAAIASARVAYGALMGCGMVPISRTNQLLFRGRLEVVLEVVVISTMEHVRPCWMVPLRALFTISMWLVYVRVGLPWPVAQAVLANLCCLAVNAAMEWLYRRMHTSARVHAKQQASADGEAGQASPGGVHAAAVPGGVHGAAKLGDVHRAAEHGDVHRAAEPGNVHSAIKGGKGEFLHGAK